MTTEIIDAPAKTAVAAYEPFYAQLAELEKNNAALAFNYEDKKGNKEARSHVNTLRLTKGALERVRVQEKAESLARGRAIDAEAGDIKARIEAMIDVHQAKLDEIEKREIDRIDGLRRRLDDFSGIMTLAATVEAVKVEIAKVQAIAIDPTWQEYMAEAATRKATVLEKLAALLAEYEKRDAEAIELARLRAETAAREQKDRDDAIAAAAAERVRKEEAARAEAAAAAAKKAIEDAEAAAKAQKEEAARRELELKAAAEASERRRVEAEAQAKRDAEAAAQREEQARLQAIQAEKDRVAAEAKAAADAQAKREANTAHLKKINGAALAALVEGGIDEDTAKKVITLIAQGKVPAVSIAY